MKRTELAAALCFAVIFSWWLPLAPLFAEVTPASGEAGVLSELDALRSGLQDGIQQQDIDKLLSFAHPDLVVTWQNGEVSSGVESVRKFFDSMLTGPQSVLTKIVMKPLKVEGRTILGDMVISYGKMEEEYFMRDGGLRFTLSSRFSAWIMRENGRLLLRGLHLSANVFDNPIKDLSVQKARFVWGACSLVAGVLLTLLLVWRGGCCKKPVT